MKIYRYKKDDKLYIISRVSPPKITGSWLEAVPWNREEKTKIISEEDLKDFEFAREE